jgi:hypothetical protein
MIHFSVAVGGIPKVTGMGLNYRCFPTFSSKPSIATCAIQFMAIKRNPQDITTLQDLTLLCDFSIKQNNFLRLKYLQDDQVVNMQILNQFLIILNNSPMQ